MLENVLIFMRGVSMNKHDFAYNLRRIIELAQRSTDAVGNEDDDCQIIKVIAEDMLRYCVDE